jgi:hypothetical protein
MRPPIRNSDVCAREHSWALVCVSNRQATYRKHIYKYSKYGRTYRSATYVKPCKDGSHLERTCVRTALYGRALVPTAASTDDVASAVSVALAEK